MEDEDGEQAATQLDRQEMLPIQRCTPIASSVPVHGRSAAAMPDSTMLEILQQVCDRLEQPDAIDMSSDEQLLQYLHSIMLDPAQFVAGNLARHHAAWQMFGSKFGHTKQAKQVLSWVAEGIKFDFVSPFCPGQEKHPRYHAKLLQVEQLLCSTVPLEQVQAMLHRDQPAPVQFAKRVSCSMHQQFVDDIIQELIKVGSYLCSGKALAPQWSLMAWGWSRTESASCGLY